MLGTLSPTTESQPAGFPSRLTPDDPTSESEEYADESSPDTTEFTMITSDSSESDSTAAATSSAESNSSESDSSAADSNPIEPVTNVDAPVRASVAPVSNAVQPLSNAVRAIEQGTVAPLPHYAAPITNFITSIQDMITSVAGVVRPLVQMPSDLAALFGVSGTAGSALIGPGGSYHAEPLRDRRLCAPLWAWNDAVGAGPALPYRSDAVIRQRRPTSDWWSCRRDRFDSGAITFRDGPANAQGRQCAGYDVVPRARRHRNPGARFAIGAGRFGSARRRRPSGDLRSGDAGRIPSGQGGPDIAISGDCTLRRSWAARCRSFGFTDRPSATGLAHRPTRGITGGVCSRSSRRLTRSRSLSEAPHWSARSQCQVSVPPAVESPVRSPPR